MDVFNALNTRVISLFFVCGMNSASEPHKWHLTCFFNVMLSKNDTRASQNGHSKVNKGSRLRRSLLVILAICFWLLFISQSAFAASATNKSGFRKIDTMRVNLDALSDNKAPTLDWRNPAYDIIFELPVSDWVESVELFVRFHAEGRVNANVPIHIQFNDDQPIPVDARGNSFEAKINLDTYFVKADRNKISMRFAKTNGCINSHDGAYSIDMKDSFLVVKTAIPSRTHSLRNAKKLLNSPLSKPKTVGLKAFGPNKLRYQALAAQAMALNLEDLPRFKLESSGDVQVIIGTRRALGNMLKGTEFEHQTGPIIGILGNSPLRLVLTADTDAELESLVDAFASRGIPDVRRSYAKGGEFDWQPPNSVINAPATGKTPLFQLGTMNFDRSWGNESQDLYFDIDNPLEANGMLDLTFETSKYVDRASKVSISLNDENIGTVELNAMRKRSRLNIPTGLFVGTANKLTISPDLSPKSTADICASKHVKSGFSVAARSRLIVNNNPNGFSKDLTRLAASGYPFSENSGANNAVVFATSTQTDLAAALRAFAQLGKIYGSGWVNSEFYTMADRPTSETANTLYIGPRINKNAPRGLASVIEGRSNRPRIIQTAELTSPAVSLLSVRTNVTGGVIALYPGDGNYLTGYITSARGHNFSRAVDQIVRTDHWNKLQGSIARWNKNHVQMVKTAFEQTGPQSTPTAKSAQLADTASNSLHESNGPTFTLPKVNLPEVSFPELKLPKIDVSFVGNNINMAAKQAKGLFDTGVTSVQSLGAAIVQPKAKSNTIKIPASAKTNQQPNQAPILSPRIEIKDRPLATGQNTTVIINEPVSQASEQYSFGRALRGLTAIERPVRAPQIVTPQYKFNQNQAAKTEVKPGIFETSSNWLSQKMDGLMGTPLTQNENRRANLLVFAIAIILLLLLLGLARPAPRDRSNAA